MPNKIRDDYENEFQNWIDSIWLIPYTEEEIGPFKRFDHTDDYGSA